MRVILALMLVSSVCVDGQNTCKRRAPATTDCSTTTGECDFIYGESNIPLGLTFPPPNTRTCYRTCHNENERCQSTPTVVTEQSLAVENQTGVSKTYRIFSPNHGQGKTYRKSTNCRYHVKCETGHILSYSVIQFDLEAPDNCNSRTECLDWVEITFLNLGTKKRLCGRGEEGEVHVDGANELLFEFATNRRTQKPGFRFHVKCIDPSTDINAVRIGAVAPPASLSDTPSAENVHNGVCSQPPNMADRPLIFDEPDAFRPTARRYTINMNYYIIYERGCIIIHDQYKITNIIRGIFRLQVANRISSTVRYFDHHSMRLRFNGFGRLVIIGQNANFHQLGANPIFQPTSEESARIIEIETAINDLLGEDSFDVLDEYDVDDDSDAIFQIPLSLVPQQTPAPQRILNRANILAFTYGNACNGILRSTACTYQALRGIDCNTGLALN